MSSFLPALFGRWRDTGTTHIVTIVLISRVYYDKGEVGYAAGPLRKDDDGVQYKDFFKVISDLEVRNDWKPTLVALKDSFWAFQRDILLAHHYHRAALFPSKQSTSDTVDLNAENSTPRLVGQLSYAHSGPILEALNYRCPSSLCVCAYGIARDSGYGRATTDLDKQAGRWTPAARWM